jgi:hypothetical protein
MKLLSLLNLFFLIEFKISSTQVKHNFVHPGGWVTVKDIQRIR